MPDKGFMRDGEVVLTDGYRYHLIRNVFYIPKELKEELQSEIVESDIPQYFACGAGMLYGLSIAAHDYSKCNNCDFCKPCSDVDAPHGVLKSCPYRAFIKTLPRNYKGRAGMMTSEIFDILQEQILIDGIKALGIPKRMLYNRV